MVQIDDAILATTNVSPGKIAMGEGEAGPRTQTLTVTNSGASPVTYDLSSVNALSTGGVITPSFWEGDADVAFSAPSLTVPAGGKASVKATIAPATEPEFGQYGGYIVLTPQGGGQVYRVPFAGFVGDYQGIQVLTSGGNGFPWLTRMTACSKFLGLECVVGGSFANRPAGETYTLGTVAGLPDVPYFLIHFEHHAERLQAIIRDAATGSPVHPVFNKAIDDEYLPRNSTSTGAFAFWWDGSRIHSNGSNGNGNDKNMTKPVPDGQYVVEVRVLKANGNASNPAHWESWTSPVITLDRP